MKRTIFCAALINALSHGAAESDLTQVSAQHFAGALISETFRASLDESSEALLCLRHQSASASDVFCFTSEDALTAHYLKLRARWLENRARIVAHCKDVEAADPYRQAIKAQDELEDPNIICTLENESIESFVARAISLMPIPNELIVPLQPADLLPDKFWDMPWKMQRCILAINIRLELLNPNKELLPEITPLDHAAKNQDEEMFFYLWKKGARHVKKALTKDFMMKSSDERSLKILREMSDAGVRFGWSWFNWAKDLDPELVLKKIYIFVKALPEYDIFSPSYCIQRSQVEKLPEDTPGEKALKEYLMKHSSPQCGDCKIL